MEGRPQRTRRAVFPPGDAKEDWKILRALSEVVGITLPYDDIEAVQKKMVEISPYFASLDTVALMPWKASRDMRTVSDQPFDTLIKNYYMTDPISRNSVTMAKCSEEILHEAVVGRSDD